MRTETITRTLYGYPELGEAAQEKVRQWVGEVFFDAEEISDDAESALDAVLGDSQRLRLTEWGHTSTRAMLKVAGTFKPSEAPPVPPWNGVPSPSKACRRIAEVIVSDQGYVVALDDRGGSLGGDATGVASEFVAELRAWLQVYIDREIERLSEDEYVADACEANGYEFLEDGTRA